MLRLTSACLVAVLSTTGSGCLNHTCTARGCSSGVDLRLSHEPEALLLGGQYAIELVGDGHSWACEFTLPGDTGCDANRNFYANVSPTGAKRIVVHSVRTPKSLIVRVTRDGSVLTDATLSPQYQSTHVDNGGGDCDEDCTYGGTHDLVLAGP